MLEEAKKADLRVKIDQAKAIVFDLDGTLLNTIDDLAIACNFALESLGFPSRNLDEVRSYVGNGVPKLLERALPTGVEIDDTLRRSLLEKFNEYYFAHCKDFTHEYEGISELVETLKSKNKLLMVLTNKIEFAAKIIIEHYFPNAFVVIAGDNPEWSLKPNPKRLLAIISEIGVSSEEVILIGDSDTDVKTAINGNCTGIAVSWGYRSREVLQESAAEYIVDSVGEILELL